MFFKSLCLHMYCVVNANAAFFFFYRLFFFTIDKHGFGQIQHVQASTPDIACYTTNRSDYYGRRHLTWPLRMPLSRLSERKIIGRLRRRLLIADGFSRVVRYADATVSSRLVDAVVSGIGQVASGRWNLREMGMRKPIDKSN